MPVPLHHLVVRNISVQLDQDNAMVHLHQELLSPHKESGVAVALNLNHLAVVGLVPQIKIILDQPADARVPQSPGLHPQVGVTVVFLQ